MPVGFNSALKLCIELEMTFWKLRVCISLEIHRLREILIGKVISSHQFILTWWINLLYNSPIDGCPVYAWTLTACLSKYTGDSCCVW